MRIETSEEVEVEADERWRWKIDEGKGVGSKRPWRRGERRDGDGGGDEKNGGG